MKQIIHGNLVDIHQQRIFPATITIEQGVITQIEESSESYEEYILCGFVDAHIHIESSMMPPYEFARVALTHGTIGAVTDPHEIANVMGMEGIKYMLKSAKEAPFYFATGVPSCVPATPFETSGATIGVEQTQELIQRPEITHLSEVMNIPAVLNQDEEMMGKMALAKSYHKPIDGHAPLLVGEDLSRYIASGISTDHEAVAYAEAKEKIQKGMKIQIRQGSSAKNFEALYPLIDEYPESCMFCSDDLHPNDLTQGHINRLVKEAIAKGCNLWNVLRVASLNPKTHYNLPMGTLQVGETADFIIVNNLEEFTLLATYVQGSIVAKERQSLLPFCPQPAINNFHATPIKETSLKVPTQHGKIRVIKAFDGELITQEVDEEPTVIGGLVVSDTSRDILKIVVIDRYHPHSPISIDFIEGFGLSQGAIASTIAHDSHNIIAVGVSDEAITHAINLLIETKGGIAAVYAHHHALLPLEIAGLMSQQEGWAIARAYERLDRIAKEQMHSPLQAPYMTLSFMALLVIPELKISDKGLFDGHRFTFVSRYQGLQNEESRVAN